MRRVIFLSLFLTFFILCSCGRSDAIAKAEEAINHIGEVTLESIEDIESAEQLYNILSDSEKSKVENRLTLAEARNSYEKLVREAEERAAYEAAQANKAKAIVGLWESTIGDVYAVYKFTSDGTFVSYAGFSLDSLMEMREDSYSIIAGKLKIGNDDPNAFSIEGDILTLNGLTFVRLR